MLIMIFKIKIQNFAQLEISKLEEKQQDVLSKDYTLIETQGIEYVRIKHLQGNIFEIKSKEIRSLFKYCSGQIIIIGVVFVKKTKKTPKEIIKLAKKRLKEV